MDKSDTPARGATQPFDLLRALRRERGAIKIDWLAIWSPPDVPDTCTARKAVYSRREGWQTVTRDWTKVELETKRRHGGIFLSYEAREQVKNQAPEDDAPLKEWVFYAINIAWALYSRAVFLEGKKCTFESYLREALVNEPRFDRPQLTDASQVLRLSLGLPRFQPTPPNLPPPSPTQSPRGRGTRAKAGARQAKLSVKGARNVR